MFPAGRPIRPGPRKAMRVTATHRRQPQAQANQIIARKIAPGIGVRWCATSMRLHRDTRSHGCCIAARNSGKSLCNPVRNWK